MANFLSDLAAFTRSVLTHWQAYMTGGFIAAILFVYERGWDKQVSSRTVIIGIIAFFMVALFLAWRDKHRESVENAKKLAEIERVLQFEKENRLPNIKLEIEDITAGRLDENGDISLLILYAAAKNIGGMPSVVDHYKLKLQISNRDPITAENVASDEVILRSPSGEGIKMDKGNYLYKKTLRPIEWGGTEKGILVFRLPGVPEQQLVDARYVLTWRDVLNQPGSVTGTIQKGPPGGRGLPFVPGIEREELPIISPTQTPTGSTNRSKTKRKKPRSARR